METAPARSSAKQVNSVLPAQKAQPASAVAGSTVSAEDEFKPSAGSMSQLQRMSAADDATADTMRPDKWLEKIRRLIDQGDLDLAQQELDEFKVRYPAEEVDQLILKRLESVQ